jgi:hypothetical protein
MLSQSRHETFARAGYASGNGHGPRLLEESESLTREALVSGENGGPARKSAKTSAKSRHFPPRVRAKAGTRGWPAEKLPVRLTGAQSEDTITRCPMAL